MRALYILFNAVGSDEWTYFELKMNANISPKDNSSIYMIYHRPMSD